MPRRDAHECCCEKPERLTERPEECTPEQIRECHGEGSEHPCCRSRAKTQ